MSSALIISTFRPVIFRRQFLILRFRIKNGLRSDEHRIGFDRVVSYLKTYKFSCDSRNVSSYLDRSISDLRFVSVCKKLSRFAESPEPIGRRKIRFKSLGVKHFRTSKYFYEYFLRVLFRQMIEWSIWPPSGLKIFTEKKISSLNNGVVAMLGRRCRVLLTASKYCQQPSC